MASKDTEVTKDHEYYVLSGLLTDSYYLSMVNGEIDDSYFGDRSCKIIYKSLTDFYEKYSKLPSADEMTLSIESNYIDLGVTLEDVKAFLTRIYALTNGAIDEDFMMDKLVELIKKVRLSRTLNKTLEVIKNGNAMNNTRVALDLIDSLNISLKRSNVLALSDVKSLTKAKRDATGTDEQKVIIKSILPSLNQAFQYKGYKFGTLNLIVSPPGTGKTSYLINEGAYASMQGFNVLHVFLGDMIHYDGFVRYASCITGRLQDDVVAMNDEQTVELVGECNAKFPGILDRIQILAYAASEISVDEMIENIKKVEEKSNTKFDMVIIDYADNLKKDDNNMYSEGGMIYDKLALFGRVNNSVIMVASQPKIGYWNTEIIPLEGAAESSKKQHIVDLMMTFNLVAREAKIGTIFMPKVRRGVSGRLVRVETAWERCNIQEISESDYVAKKSQLGMV